MEMSKQEDFLVQKEWESEEHDNGAFAEDDSGAFQVSLEDLTSVEKAFPVKIPSWRATWLAARGPRVSDEAREAWLGYYAGLYQDRGPNPALYLSLLRAYGVWDIPVPYKDMARVPGMSHVHYEQLWSENGVVLKDIDFLLEVWQKRLTKRSDAFYENPTEKKKRAREKELENLVMDKAWIAGFENDDFSEEWLKLRQQDRQTMQTMQEKMRSLHDGWTTLFRWDPTLAPMARATDMERLYRTRDAHQRVMWIRDAALCVALWFMSPEPMWQWTERIIHPVNRRLLTSMVFRHASLSQKQAKRLRSVWETAGWLPEKRTARHQQTDLKKSS